MKNITKAKYLLTGIYVFILLLAFFLVAARAIETRTLKEKNTREKTENKPIKAEVIIRCPDNEILRLDAIQFECQQNGCVKVWTSEYVYTTSAENVLIKKMNK